MGLLYYTRAAVVKNIQWNLGREFSKSAPGSDHVVATGIQFS
jgi:hypothetical protein